MGKERLIGWVEQKIRSAKEIVKERPDVHVGAVFSVAAASALGVMLARGVEIDNPAVIVNSVALGLNTIATGVDVIIYRRETETSKGSDIK